MQIYTCHFNLSPQGCHQARDMTRCSILAHLVISQKVFFSKKKSPQTLFRNTDLKHFAEGDLRFLTQGRESREKSAVGWALHTSNVVAPNLTAGSTRSFTNLTYCLLHPHSKLFKVVTHCTLLKNKSGPHFIVEVRASPRLW